jgi:cation diffusion facilitator family transporter
MNPSPEQISKQKRYIAIRDVTILAVVINILLTIIKITFGIEFQSQSLIADGMHSLSNIFVDVMILIAAKYSMQPPNAKYPYGYRRITTVVTIAAGVLLLLIAASLFMDVMNRLSGEKALLEPSAISLVIAIFSFIIKEALYHYTIYVAKRVHSPMLQANAWHHRADALSSAIVVMGVLGYLAGFLWLDAVAAIVISLMIAYIGFLESIHGINQLIDSGLGEEQLSKIRQIVKSVDGVHSMHQLRTRKMGIYVLVDMRILVAPRISVSESHKICETIETRLTTNMEKIIEVLIHVDLEGEKMDKITLQLPFRNEIIARLRQRWQSLKAQNAIEQITLHYLSGKMTIDIDLPLSIVQNIKEAQLLSQRFSELVADEPDIYAINIYYRSTVSQPVLKRSELQKFIDYNAKREV